MAWQSCLQSILGVLLLTGTVLAQSNTSLERFDRQLEQIRRETRVEVNLEVPMDQRLSLDYGASFTYSFGAIDDSTFHTHLLQQYQVVAFARLDLDGVHQFFVRGSSTYRDFMPGSDSFDAHGDDWEQIKLDRAVYRFDLNRALGAYGEQVSPVNVIVEGGRQFVHWFNGLTLSETLDGAQITVTYEKFSLKTLIAKTIADSFDIDPSRPNYDGDTKRNFYGGILSVNLNERHTPYVYGLVQRDNNNSDPLVSTVSGTVITQFQYDSWYVGTGSTGSLSDKILYGLEMVYEGGRGLSNSFDSTGVQITQTKEAIHAYAINARLDYLFNGQNHSRVGAEVLLASGDSDRLSTTDTFGGNKTGTSDRAFNAFGLVNTGLAFSPTVSNLLMVRLGASTFPLPNAQQFKRMQVGTNLFFYNKLNKNGPIAESSTNRTFLGFESDMFVNWQLTSDLSWAARYGIFFGGDALTTNSNPRNFFFTSLTLAF